MGDRKPAGMLRCCYRIPAPPHHTQSQLVTTWAGICAETSTCEVISHTHPVTPQQAGDICLHRHYITSFLLSCWTCLQSISELRRRIYILCCLLLTPQIICLPPSDQYTANLLQFSQLSSHKQSQSSTCLAFSETTRTSRRVASLAVLLV